MKALGAPGSFLLELFGDSRADIHVKAKADPLSVNTMLCIEVTLAQKCGLTLTAYKKLPRKERRIFYFHYLLEGKKEEHTFVTAQEESQRKAKMNTPSSKSSFR